VPGVSRVHIMSNNKKLSTCPKCGHQTTIISYGTDDMTIKRSRTCTSCEYSFTTVELSLDDYMMMLKNHKLVVEVFDAVVNP